MYKLAYFRAVNLIGFMSGLGKREVEIDLRKAKKGKLYQKDVITILGENATGKSTFLSLIHPTYLPADDRVRFVIPGKEGVLVREYDAENGTTIRTKCVYTPKKNDDGHTPKCSFTIIRPGEEPQELNPNGNVSSYNDLLLTHFGITKDFVNFASYSDAVDHIVKLNGTERKNSVSSLIPNTGRFELAYNTINEKWKEIRNMLRNVSQKILQIRDEETLDKQIESITEVLVQAEIDKDEYLQKLAKAEGRVKELSKGEDMRTLLKLRDKLVKEGLSLNSDYKTLLAEIERLADSLDEEPEDLPELVHKKINHYTWKLSNSTSTYNQTQERVDKVRTEIDQCIAEIDDAEAALFSIETYDIDQLKRDKATYEKRLNELRYTHHKELYENMTYDEVVSFSKSISVMDRMVQSLYEEYGEMVSRYFKNRGRPIEHKNTEALRVQLATSTAKKDEIYRKLIEKEQYKSLQDTLAKRPVSCKIDTCPFIVEALKWEKISVEIESLRAEYKEIDIEIGEVNRQLTDIQKEAEFMQAAQNLVSYVNSQSLMLIKYLYTDPEKLFRAIGNGTWMQVLDPNKLKSIAAILSEKDLYNKITTQLLPDINHTLSIATAYGTNREMLENQIARVKRAKEHLENENADLIRENTISLKMAKVYSDKLTRWQSINNLLKKRTEYETMILQQSKDFDQLNEAIQTISELVEKCKDYDRKLHDAEAQIRVLTPKKQQLEMDMRTLVNLKLEKEQLEQNFIIVEVMKMIVQPGKGIRKELINIYMYDIYQLANQLLLDTFDGKLYLKEFVISDKEFILPYVYAGETSADISYASSSQQSTIAIALSLAIISKLVDKYGVITIDEADRTLSADNKAVFANILLKRMKILGISQTFVCTHSPELYESTDSMGIIAFPGARFNKKENDYIEI